MTSCTVVFRLFYHQEQDPFGSIAVTWLRDRQRLATKVLLRGPVMGMHSLSLRHLLETGPSLLVEFSWREAPSNIVSTRISALDGTLEGGVDRAERVPLRGRCKTRKAAATAKTKGHAPRHPTTP